MQSYKFDEIIDRACEKKQLDKELMKSISDFIFTETKAEMGLFSNLRIQLEGLITFFYGKKRLLDFKSRLLDDNKRKKISFLNKKSPEEIGIVEERVDVLLDTYEVYIQDKKDTKANYRKQRDEHTRKISLLEGESEESTNNLS